MTSIGKNCYTDRIVLDDDIVLKSLPSGKYLVSGDGGKISYTNEIPLTSGSDQTVEGVKTFTSLIQGSVSGASASCDNSATTDKLNNKLNIGTNLTLASGEDEWDAENEDTINLDLDLSSYARKDQANSFSGTQTFVQKIVGNIDTANKLKNARNIGGVSFDGSANINLPGVNAAGNQNTSGNANTATTLETARTIGGVSFDGGGNINLPGVNIAGNQNTSGNANTATTLETARTIAGVSFDGGSNIEIPSTNLSDSDDLVRDTGDQTIEGTKTFKSGNNHEIIPTEISYDLVYGQGGSTFSGTAPSLMHSGNQMWFRSKDNNNESQFHFATMLSGDTSYGQTGYLRLDVHSTEGITFNSVGKNWSSSTVPDMGFLSQTKQYNFHGGSGNRIYIDCDNFEIAKYSSGTKQSNGITFNGNLTGNANTATSLQTARTIAGVSFDGGSNIEIPSTGLSDTNTLIYNTDDRLTKISTSTNSSQSRYAYTIDMSSSNETFQALNIKGNNAYIAAFDLSQIMFSANIYVLPSKYITYPYGTAGEFIKLDSSQNMVSTTLSSSDISDIGDYVKKDVSSQVISTADTTNLKIKTTGTSGKNSELILEIGNGDKLKIALERSSREFKIYYAKYDENNGDFIEYVSMNRWGKLTTQKITCENDFQVGEATDFKVTESNGNTVIGGTLNVGGNLTTSHYKEFSTGAPLIFGTDLTSQSVTDIVGICQSNSTSTRKFAISNLSSGASYLKLSNSEGSFLYGTNENKMFLYRESDNSLLQAIDSDKTHIFYSPVSITGNVLTTGTITTDKKGTFGSVRIFDSNNDDNTIIDIYGSDDDDYTRGYISCSSQTGKFQRLYIRMENVDTVLFRDTSTLFYTNVSLQNNNLQSVANLTCDKILNKQSNSTTLEIERFKGSYTTPVWVPTNPVIPSGPGSYSSRFRINIKPTDFLSDDDNTALNRVIVQDSTTHAYSYGGTYFKSTTDQELFVYKEIPHRSKLVALKIVTVHRTTQTGGASAQALEVDIFRVSIIYPSEIKETVVLTSTPSTKHTNEVISFSNSNDELDRTEGPYNQNPVVMIGLDNAGPNGVYKGGYLEFEYV